MNKKTIILESLSKDDTIFFTSKDGSINFSKIDLNITVYFDKSMHLGYKTEAKSILSQSKTIIPGGFIIKK